MSCAVCPTVYLQRFFKARLIQSSGSGEPIMKTARTIILLVALAGLASAESAWARGGGHGSHGHHFQGHHRSVFFVGSSLFWPYWSYPYYPYYAPSVVMVPSAPPVYIEQGNPQPTALQQMNNWYHCATPEGYYPYIKQCQAGWEIVSATPPNQELDYWYYCSEPKGYYPYVKECSAGWKKIVPGAPPSSLP